MCTAAAQPSQATAPSAAVSPPKRQKLRRTCQEPTRAAREETIDPQLVDLDDLPSAPVAPATRKRQRAPKAEPGPLAENPIEHAVTTSERLPQADEDALAAELCKAAGESSGVESRNLVAQPGGGNSQVWEKPIHGGLDKDSISER